MKIQLIGWLPGMKTVSCIQAINKFSGIGLIASKQLVEELLGDKVVEIGIKKEDVAKFKTILQELGVLYCENISVN